MNAVCKGRTFRYVVDMLGVSVDACSPCSFIHTTSRRGDVVRSSSIADSLLHTQQDVARRNEAKRLVSWRKTRRRVPCVCMSVGGCVQFLSRDIQSRNRVGLVASILRERSAHACHDSSIHSTHVRWLSSSPNV